MSERIISSSESRKRELPEVLKECGTDLTKILELLGKNKNDSGTQIEIIKALNYFDGQALFPVLDRVITLEKRAMADWKESRKAENVEVEDHEVRKQYENVLLHKDTYNYILSAFRPEPKHGEVFTPKNVEVLTEVRGNVGRAIAS